MRSRRLLPAAALVAAVAGFTPAPAAAQIATLRYPQVDVAPDGAAVVVWNNQSMGTIHARRRAANGVLGPTRLVSAPGTVGNVDPRVGVDGNGVATIMWRKNGTGGSGVVQTRRFLPDSTQGVIVDVSPPSTPINMDLAVSQNGIATFAWGDVDAAADNDVVRVRQRVGGNALRPLRTVDDDVFRETDVDVATDPAGNATIAWTEWDYYKHALTTRRLSSAGTFGTPDRINAVDTDATGIELAVAPSGRATFVWTRVDAAWNQRIETRWRDPSGTVGTLATLSATGWANLPQVAGDQDGDMTFTWLRDDGTYDRTQTRTRFAGGTMSTVQTLSAATGDVSHPKVDVSPTGVARFAWNIRTNSANAQVQTRRRLASGTLGTVVPLSAAGSHNIEQQVAVDPNGNAIMVWTRQADSNNPLHIQLRRIDAAGNISTTQNLE